MNRMLGEGVGAGSVARRLCCWVMNPEVRALAEACVKSAPAAMGKNAGGRR